MCIRERHVIINGITLILHNIPRPVNPSLKDLKVTNWEHNFQVLNMVAF